MASGWCWMVMNLQDSCSNHHPTTTRGFLRTVNWNLNGAEIPHNKDYENWAYKNYKVGVFPFFRSRGETRGEPELKAQQR
jgi:hypothetical protein